MSFQLYKWSIFCCLLAFQINNGLCSSINGDTLRLDINSSYFSGSYVEIPVTFSSAGSVFAVDMAFRFDANRLIFDDVVNPAPGLQYLFYLNPNDSVWRFTSYDPSGLITGTPICHLRFFSLSNEACAYDFGSQEGYINGDSCNIEIQGCMDNVGFGDVSEGLQIHVYPNPFTNGLYVESPSDTQIEIFDFHGRLICENYTNTWIETTNWAYGGYFVKVIDKKTVRYIRVHKL